MSRFFANQRLDEAGIVGVTLQKLLIFFMVIDAVAFFCGLSLFSSFMSLLFHFVVFMGVYRRRTGVLLLYVVFHVAFFILAAFALIFVVSSLMYVTPEGYDDFSSSDDYVAVNRTHNYDLRSILNYGYNYNYTSSHNSTHHGWDPKMDSSDSFDYEGQSVFVVSLVALLFSVIVLYCKILSVVLAHRMRKLLLSATVLPVSRPVESDAQPTFVPVDFEKQPALFAHPGFAYQPMVASEDMYPGQSAMMPAPFMYGQHPVFYSYAPESNNNNKNNDGKL